MCHLLVIPSLYTPSLCQHCGRSGIPTLKPILQLILVINHSTSWSKQKGNKGDKPIFSLSGVWEAWVWQTHPHANIREKQAQSEEGTATASSNCCSQQMTEQGLPKGPPRHRQSPGQRKEGKHHPAGYVLRLLTKQKGETRRPGGQKKRAQLMAPAEQFNCLSRGNRHSSRVAQSLWVQQILVDTAFDS